MKTASFNKTLDVYQNHEFGRFPATKSNSSLGQCLLPERPPYSKLLSEVSKSSCHISSIKRRSIARSFYSTFVESFECPAQRSESSLLKAIRLDQDKNLKSANPFLAPCETKSHALTIVQAKDQTQCTTTDLAREQLGSKDNYCPNADIGLDTDTKKQFPHGAPPSMSLSIGSSISGCTASYTMGALGALGPLGTVKMKGATGVFMVFTVAVLGIMTALFNHPQVPLKSCSICNGRGVEKCDLCNGRGKIKWEGKLQHLDPCPICFGSSFRKCSACFGKCYRR